jgi:hypothetical protein
MKYTVRQHEAYLNEQYSSCYAWNDVLDNFSHHYKTNRLAERYLIDYYNNHTLGTLLRSKDPIAFNVSLWDRIHELRERSN